MRTLCKRFPIPILLIGAFLLSACTGGGGEAAKPGVTPQPETAVTASSAESDAGAAAAADTPPAAATTDSKETAAEQTIDESDIMTEDDRSGQLRSLTGSWNTNWERHTIDYSELLSGGPPRDGIPSLDDPGFVDQETAAEWLAGNEPVVALEINGEARAYPLSILTYHEIANDEVGGAPVAVTFCPLCNSAIVFDRRLKGETYEFGVSGLLRNSDLVMYDRTTESLWQQLTGEAIVGDLAGYELEMLPSSLVSFSDFREAYPEAPVLSRETGFNRPYGRNPYAGYDGQISASGSSPFFQGEMDGRLPAGARVIAVELEEAGIDIAYPLPVLREEKIIQDERGGQPLVIFFKEGTASALGAATIAQAEDVGAASVFDPTVDGEVLTFRRDGDAIIDEQTGSVWNLLGQAVAGELAGTELTPIVHGNHFWFAWAAFKPDTIIYEE